MGLRKKRENVKDAYMMTNSMQGINDKLFNIDKQERSFKGDERDFMFGVALYLGEASNNYAEYVGVILAQLILCMFKHTSISIVTDSMLIVNQIKGVAKTKNFRLVELIKVVRIHA